MNKFNAHDYISISECARIYGKSRETVRLDIRNPDVALDEHRDGKGGLAVRRDQAADIYEYRLVDSFDEVDDDDEVRL